MSAKQHVLLTTTVGDIDVELWAKETPKTCRNFIQLCLDGYYDNTIFHRVYKEEIPAVMEQEGNQSTGSRLRMNFTNGFGLREEVYWRWQMPAKTITALSFFFTLGPTPELQNKHTLFGKVTGETIFNMLKLEEGLIEDEKPVYPHKILKTEVLNNPFPDVVPRVTSVKVGEKKKKEKKTGVKRGQEDEEQSTRENEKYLGKGKSTHDILDDPKLSSNTEELSADKNNPAAPDPEEQLENIRKKLKTDHKKSKTVTPVSQAKDDDDLEDYYLHKDRDIERKKKMEEIKKEIQNVKKDYQKNKLRQEVKTEELKEEETKSELFKEYKEEYDKYKHKHESLPKKGSGREQFTLGLLEKFKERLQNAKNKEDVSEEANEEDADNEESWLSHRLKFEEINPVLAKDANTKGRRLV
ncbi:hypothetical protein NQ318_003854 [Aromia moschata]|uniref:Spliceosome-associated protein CWC27 homolog n=1 Tax=Aromia moschata TaxID=1265417 RepID=A0AAV8Z9A8_9CUCU|nr:hypothetical protein NQ318_003854 [Aromia moschata]